LVENKIASYFTNLSQLACENYLPESPEKDSILQSVPFMKMDMIYRDHKSHLTLFPAEYSQSEYSTDIPRYYLDYNGKDFMIAQHEVIKGALRYYGFFFQ
jgi:hypothetical protein